MSENNFIQDSEESKEKKVIEEKSILEEKMKQDVTHDFQIKKRRIIFKRVLCTIALVFLLLLVILPGVVIYFVTKGPIQYNLDVNHPLQKIYTSEYFGLDANEMMLETEDGLHVWASEVAVPEPKGVIIYLTGIRQPSITYYYGHSKWMKENGYATILLEVRGHGESEGNQVCLGYEEINDVKAVVDYIKNEEKYKNIPLIIQGVSMGGAIAINSFGQIDEIDGLIAMSAYSSFEDVVYDTMRNYKVPKLLCDVEKPLIKLYLRAFFGDKVTENRPINQVKNIGDRPAFFIASTNDSEVPPENMERLLKNSPDHCISWLRDSEAVGHFIIKDHNFEDVKQDEEYCERILEFLKQF